MDSKYVQTVFTGELVDELDSGVVVVGGACRQEEIWMLGSGHGGLLFDKGWWKKDDTARDAVYVCMCARRHV